MVRTALLPGVLFAFVMALPAAAPAAEAERSAEAEEKAAEIFHSLYGADFERVRKSWGSDDDVDLAVRLLDAAREGRSQPALLAVMCEKAYGLAADHRDGYRTAIAAMNLLSAAVPERAEACEARAAEVGLKQFHASSGDERTRFGRVLIALLLARADRKAAAGAADEAIAACKQARTLARDIRSERLAEIETRLTELEHASATRREIEKARAALAKHPKDQGAREHLLGLLLVDSNDPAGAAECAQGMTKTALGDLVRAAAAPLPDLSPKRCLDLGEWYRLQAGQAASGARRALLVRAQRYYRRFLELHTTEDMDRAAGTLAVSKVAKALDEMGGAPWIDLLAQVDPATDAVTGLWRRHADGVAIAEPQKHSRLLIPVAPQGSYELDVRFVRLGGTEDVNVILPVGTSQVMLMLSGWQGTVSGLELVGGKRASSNETTVRPAGLETGRQHSLHLRVLVRDDLAEIAVVLDGKDYLRWRGPVSALTLDPYWRLPEKACLGLGAYCTVVFQDVRLRMLSGGKATILRPPPEAKPPDGAVAALEP